MGKQFAVLHIEKGSGNATRLGSHIDRKFQPSNADPNKRHLNKYLITGNNLNQDIDERIKQSGAKVRKNSVKHLNIVLTGSHEQMKEIEKNSAVMQKWIDDNYKFLKEKYGKENIMRLSLHRDERTPHLHAVVTPITPDNRLSAKQVVGNKNDLRQIQDDYAERMKKYNLNRGIRGSTATHDSIKEYYARINNPVQSQLEIPSKRFFEGQKKYFQKILKSLEPVIFENKYYKSKISDVLNKEKELSKRQEKIENIEQHINEVKNSAFEKGKKLVKQKIDEATKEKFNETVNQVNDTLQKHEIPAKFEYDEENDGYDLKENYHKRIKSAKAEGYKTALKHVNNLLKKKNIKYQVKINPEENTLNLQPQKNKNKGLEL